ncbi:flagellar hook-basal body protein [Desulfoscipio gibsoniae]|uniref:Flagellar hook-basal body protein n=1 Tax=Desulfoscipio gibsoniae DSM 7213 TaxID=767817 RepID=R4KPS0_9FIRM|nr:flagellar hook basal-body protein [Desulfoscipio gibsoniae]AGL01651.1 flagellar hook-basal body protein [Desulfoscipio gibsoniae DSM 7213]
MIPSMGISVSGISKHQLRLDVISNNIANVNTTGFKSGRANFKDMLYLARESNRFCQSGNGVAVSEISNNFTQGVIQPTGRNLDLAIDGNGFFGVIDDNDELKFTRDGSFHLDAEGYLVNSSGLRVVDDGESEIQIDNDDLEEVQINQNGEIFVGKESTNDIIGLFNFTNLSGLTKVGDNLYSDNEASGERLAGEPGEEGLGVIRSGALEMSNTELTNEMTDLIVTQRGFQANAKVFTTADEVLQGIIELKR